MYRVLVHGSDEREYRSLKDVLPDNIKLNYIIDRNRLLNMVDEDIHGIVLRFSNPDYTDLTFVKKVSDSIGFAGVIVVVSGVTPAQAVSCMRNGAYDCFVGPLDGETISPCLVRMIDTSFSMEQKKTATFISGDSRIMADLRKRLVLLAKDSHPVLITGETGSGKDLAARTIHMTSSRREEPFIAVNCAAYTDELLRSELFGSLRGAYTDSTDRPGLFESSHGGTLFLDEIGELSPCCQSALLRIIEDGTIRRMGGVKTKHVDVRIIAATNRNIDEAIQSGTFRRDLYYRLSQLAVNIPPLRKHREDIPRLVREYLKKNNPQSRWKIDSAAMAKLIRYSWPGNVRELQSVVLNASLSAKEHIIRSKNIVL